MIPPGAPEALCPTCLLKVVVASPHPHASPASGPTVHDLERHLPQLRIVGLLGQGGMGSVFEAVQVAIDRRCALKVLSPGLSSDLVFCQRFEREATALAKLQHPHIVRVFDSGRVADYLYILMELIEGVTLRELLAQGRLSPRESLRLIPQVCDALQYAHDRGVVHRDIKPENILVDLDGNAKLVDFGLAKVMDDPQRITLTEAHARMGTPRYMAPEQFKQTSSSDHRSDIYSVGVLFYEMLTGDLPAPDFQPPSRCVKVDPRVDRVVERSLKNSPELRYQKAVEVKADVERITSTSGHRQRSWYRAAAAAAAILLLGLLLARWPRQGPAVAAPAAVTASAPEPQAEWTAPVNLGASVNSEQDDGGPTLSEDGLTLMFHSWRPGGLGQTDLWEAHRATLGDTFQPARNMGKVLNSPEHDGEPTLADGGKLLIFVSHRAGSLGNSDLWESRRPSIDAPWGSPRNLGPGINSDSGEQRPSLSTDGLVLVYTGRSMGPVIARRPRIDAEFGEPMPLRLPEELRSIRLPYLSGDQRHVVLDRALPGDFLWVTSRGDTEEEFRPAASLGPAVNSGGIGISPAISADGSRIIFASNRAGTVGDLDIWETRKVATGRGPRPK